MIPLTYISPHLEKISSVIRNSDFRNFVREASDRSEMVDILKEVDEAKSE